MRFFAIFAIFAKIVKIAKIATLLGDLSSLAFESFCDFSQFSQFSQKSLKSQKSQHFFGVCDFCDFSLKSQFSHLRANLDISLWCRLTTLSITCVKPTQRSCRGGLKKDQRNLLLCHGTDHLLPCLGNFSEGNPISLDANCGQDEGNLHIPSAMTLNIQIDTFVCGSQYSRFIPVIQSRSHSRVRFNNPACSKTARARVISRDPAEKVLSSPSDVQEHGVSLLLASTMSIAPKIDEVRSVILDWSPDLAFFTQTWLRDTISDNLINIPGYHFTSRNRSTDILGGVGLYN